MLYRKIRSYIEAHLKSDDDKILLIEGARQIGKSFIIRDVGKALYQNFVEINLVTDDEGDKIFKDVHKTEDLYLKLSMIAGDRLDKYGNTLVFIDEIQHYPQFLTMLKFLREDRRYRFICSGSMLGIALKRTVSIPIGSIIPKKMYQLDFEEFLFANSFGAEAVEHLRYSFEHRISLSPEVHDRVMDLFKKYLLVGGMPDAVNTYLSTHNIVKVREIQDAIRMMYGVDSSRYEQDASKQLKIRSIYNMIPSQMESRKKRIVAKNISGKKGDRFSNYLDEFEYLISSGIAISVNAISNPKYPLAESGQKNLLKLYLNDVGILTSLLYQYNLQPVLNDMDSINLGSVYESVVAQEIKAHDNNLYYYDNKQKGEVDFLIDDSSTMSVLPIEVKSGKDYSIHSALNKLMQVTDYHIVSSIVLSNEREIKSIGKILYLPIYFAMFIGNSTSKNTGFYF